MTTTDISDIQRQMAQIRNEMHQEVQSAVRGAQSLTDWQAVLKNHPWLTLAAATTAGYLIVPRRHAPAPTFVTMSGSAPLMAPAARIEESKKSPWRFVGLALSLVAPIAVRAAQNYVLGHVEQWLAQHPLAAGPGRPGDESTHRRGEPARQAVPPRVREFG